MFVVRSQPLSRGDADAASETLSEAEEPQAAAVSLVEVDEGRALWQVEAYYDAPPAPAALAALGLDPATLAVEPLPEADWVARSLEGLGPVAAGRFTVHGRHDRGCLPPGGIAVEIAAGTAFGTGHHPTTLGCLMAADRLLKQRRPHRILDVGSGTGVLAIAAAKATRAPALAIDNDSVAVHVTAENARINAVHNRVAAAQAPPAGQPVPGQPQRFDLIFANILAGPLVRLARRLSAQLAPGGSIVLSGLTVGQERQVAAAYRNRGLRLDRRLRIDNWSTLVLVRPQGAKKPGRNGRAAAGQSLAQLRRTSPQTMRWISLRLRPMSESSRSSSDSR